MVAGCGAMEIGGLVRVAYRKDNWKEFLETHTGMTSGWMKTKVSTKSAKGREMTAD